MRASDGGSTWTWPGARLANRRSRHAAVLQDQVAGGRDRAPRPVELRCSGLLGEQRLEAAGASAPPSAARRRPTASISSMKMMHCPPHLRASLRALRIRNITTTTSMPMNVCAKPEPGIVTIGELNDVAIAFDNIVLPVPGWPMNSRPRSGLPPALRNSSPRLPQLDDAGDVLLGLGLPADVLQPHAPVGVARLVALHLLEAEEQQRPEEDREVDEEQQRQLDRHVGDRRSGSAGR